MKPHLRITIETLHKHGAVQREIERRTGVDRKTIRHYLRRQIPPGWPPALWARRRKLLPWPPALERGGARKPELPPGLVDDHGDRVQEVEAAALGRHWEAEYPVGSELG